LRTLKNLLRIRQHVIYIVLALIALVLTRAGVFWAILLVFAYPFRFPRSYPYFFVAVGIFFLRFWLGDQPVPQLVPKGIQVYEAQVVQVRRQLPERQVAVIALNGENIYLTFPEGEPKLLPGDWISVTGELQDPSPVRVPHGFDFSNFLRGQGISRTLFARDLEVTRQGFSPWRYQHLLSRWVSERLPPMTAAYVQALFLGQRDGLDGEWLGALSDLGIIHVFAISGLHVGLLSGILAYGLKRVGVIEEIAQFILIGFLAAFAFIAGGSPSIVRAASMSALAILNRRLKWRLSSLDIFSLVFLANVWVAPFQIRQVGFVYSYWLTVVLILSREFLRPLKGWQLLLFFPLLAQLGALPLTLFFNYEVNLWAYGANLLLVPVVTGLLIPALLLATLVPVISYLTEPVLLLFQQLGLSLARHFFRPWVTGAIHLQLLLLLLVLFLAASYGFERFRKWLIWPGMLGLMVLILEANRLSVGTQITFVDVGQGDAIVLQSPLHSCVVVVDTGGDVAIGRERRSIFPRTLEPFLLGEGIRVIDYLVITHSDFDHYGEALPLMARFPIRNLVINDEEFSNIVQSDLYREVLATARENGTQILTARTGDLLTCGNQAYTFLQPVRVAKDTNDTSLVKLVEMAGVQTLLTGDIGFEVEPYILRNLGASRVDIYKSAHHGSRFSNSLAFMERVNPQVAVVTAGVGNRYGHPTQEWFDVMEALGIRQFDTPSYGTVQFLLDGEGGFRVRTWLGGEGPK